MKISVITPVHNTELNLLKSTIESVSGISFNREDIEWIVVFHNCEEKYVSCVKQMFSGCDIRISDYILNDKNHTPAAPRNYGIEKAKGEYVYFLDSDDIIEPFFLKSAYEKAIANDSQIVIAGARAESVSQNVMPLPMPLLLYSQDGEFNIDNDKYLYFDESAKKRRNREILGRLIYGAPMFLGTKLISRRLIIEGDHHFDNDLEFLEDVLFEAGLYGDTKKITVLTDENSYIYIQNEGSTFQSIISKEKASSLSLMEPVKRIVRLCEKEDIDYTLFLWSIFEMYGSALLRDEMPAKVKYELKEKMSQYVSKLRFIPYIGSRGAKELLSMKFLSDIFIDKEHRVYEQDRVEVRFQNMVSEVNKYSGIAVVSDEGELSYKELGKRSDKLAGYIKQNTGGKEAVVGIYMDNSIDRLIALIAVLKAGNPFVVLSKLNTKDRLSYILNVVKAYAIITDDANLEANAFSQKDLNVLKYNDALNGDNCDFKIENVKDDAALVTEFTSGSEGTPKGVTFTRRNFVNLLYHFDGNIKNCLQARLSNTYIIHMEIDFLFGLLVSLEALLFGKKLCLLKNPKDINAGFVKKCLALDEGVSMSVVPSVADEWFSDDNLKGLFKNVKFLVYGGEGIKAEQLERAQKALKKGTPVYSGYATTETGPAVYGPVTKEHITCGIPQADVSVTIIDDDGNPVPRNEKGRVCIKGYRVAKGYINGENDDFIEDRSGINTFISRDEGYITDDGELVICGRLDRMIKNKGVRVDPSEIEKAVISYKGIENVAVKAFDKTGICCFYTSKEEVDEYSLRTYLSDKLPYFMMPEAFIRLKKMPVTGRGKLDIKSLELPGDYFSQKDESKGRECDTKTLEKVLNAFSEVFDDIEIAGNENFFYLGGDSIKAVELSLIIEDLGLPVEMKDIFAYPTPFLLSRAIDDKKTTDKRKKDISDVSPKEYINDTGNDKYDALPKEGALYSFEISGITKGYYTMPLKYREAYRYALRIQYETSENLNKDIFIKRVNDMVKRHPVLRMEFVTDKNRVYGIINKDKDIEVTYRDIESYPESTKDSYISGFWHIMDEENPLFSVACFKVGSSSHVVLVRMAHTITDAIGSSILLKELSSAFEFDGNEDSFIENRRKLRQLSISQKDSAKEFFLNYLKGATPAKVNPPFGMVEGDEKVLRRIVKLNPQKCEELRNRCALLGIAFENYIQYEYGKALSEALNEDRVIFLCTFSGRDADNMGAVGNFFTILPVVYDKKMSTEDFSLNMLKLGEFTFLDADMTGKLVGIPFSALGTAEGINSNLLTEALKDEHVTSSKQVIFGDLRGKRMYKQGDDIVIEMSYYDYGETDRIYRAIEKNMKKSLGII